MPFGFSVDTGYQINIIVKAPPTTASTTLMLPPKVDGARAAKVAVDAFGVVPEGLALVSCGVCVATSL